MAQDAMQAINEAERTISARKVGREAGLVEFRKAQALELIADEMTRLRAEVETLRYLFATYAARPPGG
jgi:hypothetical protein